MSVCVYVCVKGSRLWGGCECRVFDIALIGKLSQLDMNSSNKGFPFTYTEVFPSVSW